MQTMTLQERQTELIEGLNLIGSPHERLAALSSYVPWVLLPEAERIDTLLVPGCVSRVWVHGTLVAGRSQFRCAADSPMVAGLVALLCHLYSQALPAEVSAIEPELWEKCGLVKVLSPTRLNGLAAVRQRLRAMAEAWQVRGG